VRGQRVAATARVLVAVEHFAPACRLRAGARTDGWRRRQHLRAVDGSPGVSYVSVRASPAALTSQVGTERKVAA